MFLENRVHVRSFFGKPQKEVKIRLNSYYTFDKYLLNETTLTKNFCDKTKSTNCTLEQAKIADGYVFRDLV